MNKPNPKTYSKLPIDEFLENYFVPNEIALLLFEIGFDERCIAWTTYEDKDVTLINRPKRGKDLNLPTTVVMVPTYDQALEFFRTKKLFIVIEPNADYEDDINWRATHDTIDFKITNYSWSVYPNFFTENNGYEYFEAATYKDAQVAAMRFCINHLKLVKRNQTEKI